MSFCEVARFAETEKKDKVQKKKIGGKKNEKTQKKMKKNKKTTK